MNMDDRDFLIDYEKDARLGAAAYLTMAGEAHDPKVKQLFLKLSQYSMETSDKFLELLSNMGEAL